MTRPAHLGALALLALLTLLWPGCAAEQADPWPSSEPWPSDLPPYPEDGSHFDGEADPYYEGWYHKVAVPEQDEAFFFIYGVLNPEPMGQRHGEALLYCGDARSLTAVYQAFAVEDYLAEAKRRDVHVGAAARATARRIAGRVEQDGHLCSWDIVLDEPVPWKDTMGWLTGNRSLETSWTVGTIVARASGWVRFDGRLVEFRDAAGYGDHNWGINFPRRWIWLQANLFDGRETAVAVSGGSVPLGESEVDAYMIGLLDQGQWTTFRTQDGDTITAEAAKGSWAIAAEDRSRLRRLTIDADCELDSLFHLLVSTGERMEPRAWESLRGDVRLRLERRGSTDGEWELVLDAASPYAGVELGE